MAVFFGDPKKVQHLIWYSKR